MIARADRDRSSIFVGLCFPADFPCHRSTKATSQRISSFVHGKLAGLCLHPLGCNTSNGIFYLFSTKKVQQRSRSPAIPVQPRLLCRPTRCVFQPGSRNLSAMGLDTVDLVVVPWPSESPKHRAASDRGERQRDGALFLKTWKALQRVVDAGATHAIGLCRPVRGSVCRVLHVDLLQIKERTGVTMSLVTPKSQQLMFPVKTTLSLRI